MTRLFFDTPEEWLDVIRAWAVTVPQVDKAWIIGSRAKGVRRPKDGAAPVPDFDIAYTLVGDDPGQLLALAIFKGDGWRQQLQAGISVPIDLQLATPEDTVVWPGVLDHGVLVYELWAPAAAGPTGASQAPLC